MKRHEQTPNVHYLVQEVNLKRLPHCMTPIHVLGKAAFRNNGKSACGWLEVEWTGMAQTASQGGRTILQDFRILDTRHCTYVQMYR